MKFSPKKIGIAIVMSLCLAAGAASARANTVFAFSSTGSFTAGSGDSVNAGPVTFGVGPLAPTISSPLQAGGGTNLMLGFVGRANGGTAPATGVAVGDLVLYGDGMSQSFASGDSFTLAISQTVPGINSGTSTGNVTGSITFTPSSTGGTDSGTLNVHFNTNPVSISSAGHPTVSYLLSDVNYTVTNLNQPFLADITLKANVTAAPAPASLWGGAGLLGLMGIFGVRRRRMMA